MTDHLPLLTGLLPIVGAVLAWVLRSKPQSQGILLFSFALLHSATVALLTCYPECGNAWLGADEQLSLPVLQLTSFLFLAVAGHTLYWLPEELKGKESTERPEGVQKRHIFSSCMLAFLGTMSFVLLARNFGLLWVAVEATTLFSAPLILFHRSGASLEAMWKYLLICSVGIGFALFGTMLFALGAHAGENGLGFDAIRNHGIAPGYFKAAFVFILAGYGTKMGLAPFHTWLPDAHSEAPGTVSALLSGTLLNCSFTAIMRFFDMTPEPALDFCRGSLAVFGMLSLLTAALFILRQGDYKRMLAYSSVEHMGLLALFAAFGAMEIGIAHLYGHSLLKVTLFLTAGNLLLACGTRKTALLEGLLPQLPRNSLVFLLTGGMICGLPPSPLFATEFLLLYHLPAWLCIAVPVLLFTIFAGMMAIIMKMLMGPPGKIIPAPESARSAERCTVIPVLLLLTASVFGFIMLRYLTGVLTK